MQPRTDQGKLHPRAKPSGVPEPLEKTDFQKRTVCAIFHYGLDLSTILPSTSVAVPMPDMQRCGEMD